MIKYKVGYWKRLVSKIEVDSETDAFVTIGNQRFKKITSYDCFFDTFEQAKQFVIKKITDDIKNSEQSIKSKQLQIVKLEKELTQTNELENTL